MIKTKDIKVADLLINPENYRFETVTGQKDAIDKMISNQDEKLLNLAEHILKHGLNPDDNIKVALSSHDKTKHIVLEGNRRVVALKLVANPDLVDQHPTLRRKFRKLHEENKGKILKEATCTVYDDPKVKWSGLSRPVLGEVKM